MRSIALVGCVKRKQPRACAARDLYTSALFRKAIAYAASNADGWFVLSAKYGLVAPGTVIEPYEKTLKTASTSQRRSWAVQVHGQMSAAGLLAPGTRFIWLAGMDYQRELAQLLRDFQQIDPLRGMRMGERLSWLSHASPPPR